MVLHEISPSSIPLAALMNYANPSILHSHSLLSSLLGASPIDPAAQSMEVLVHTVLDYASVAIRNHFSLSAVPCSEGVLVYPSSHFPLW